MYRRTCKECGKVFNSRQPTAEFDVPACRKVWNNRRAMRGAIVYDLVMLADDPDALKNAGITDRLDRIVENWRAEDTKSGRRTYRKARDVALDTARLANSTVR